MLYDSPMLFKKPSRLKYSEARYVQCESVHATELSPVHLRHIETSEELRPGGGPPQDSLCGTQTAWDIEVRDMDLLVTWSKTERARGERRPGLLCVRCVELYDAR